jgi:hypothetical protein
MKKTKNKKSGMFKKILWGLSPLPNRPMSLIWNKQNQVASNMIMDSLNTIRVKPKKQINKEKFEESVKRLGLTEDDLYKKEKFYMIGFYIIFAFLSMSVILSFKCIYNDNYLGAFSAFGSTTLFFNISLMWSYRFWIVNNRYFGSFWEYIKSYQYFPILQGN